MKCVPVEEMEMERTSRSRPPDPRSRPHHPPDGEVAREQSTMERVGITNIPPVATSRDHLARRVRPACGKRP